MKAYYNLDGIGDILILKLKETEKQNETWKRINGVTCFYDKDSKEVTGYNVFDFSSYGEISGKGEVTFTDEIKEAVNLALKQNKVDERI
ncbi:MULTISPECIES: DUF4479 domain-containing protein [Alteribacter]|uniref:DUF4479 domain-containing protein n=1 Tax=Alteribacter keqinensis TaxID=2483800 RepID=A0A3M7U128_9BACI|nr:MULTISPECIES: DUF4479 domain-containing protein [Alteribacter]MBM7096397.1 DUF4479 domain-containing protein [Alteribacter salitolerans]RNA70385.1 DUF4479 domain-containing protein [Alteribacter keqinensis]